MKIPIQIILNITVDATTGAVTVDSQLSKAAAAVEVYKDAATHGTADAPPTKQPAASGEFPKDEAMRASFVKAVNDKGKSAAIAALSATGYTKVVDIPGDERAAFLVTLAALPNLPGKDDEIPF